MVYPRRNLECNMLEICFSNSGVEPESAILHDASELLSFNNDNNDGPNGLLNDKYPLHIISHPTKKNTFTNRISYDTQSNSYYENGIIDKKYLEFWDKGVLYYENLKYATKYSCDTRLLTALFPDDYDQSSSIIYKFDYSSYENLEISLLNLELKCFVEHNNYKWEIYISTDECNNNLYDLDNLGNLVSTTSDFVVPSVKWIKIKETDKNISEILTYHVTNRKFFYIKVEIRSREDFLSLFMHTRNIQPFPSSNSPFKDDDNIIKNNYNIKNNNDIEKFFTFDVIVELSSLLESNNLTKLFKSLRFKSTNSSIEKGKPLKDIVNNKDQLISGGLFNDKYRFNVLQSKEKKSVYTHRISYNIIKNAYYENGIYDVKYLKRWDRGTFAYNNIYYDPYHIDLSHDKKNLPAYITWKFDYRIGNLYLSSLKLKLWSSSNTEKIKWSIQLLPTRKNPNPEFKSIDLLQKKEIDYFMDLTEVVKNEYGFILKAHLDEIENNNHIRVTISRRSDWSLLYGLDKLVVKDGDQSFCMDVKMELKPNMICDDLINDDNIEVTDENLLLFNDKNTSDFIIKLELPKENDDTTEKIFYTHKKILSSRSDYFHALLNSNMIESRNGCLKLNDISYHIFEKLLLFIYTDNIENINEIEIDDWIDLLYASSKFLLPKLFQICELSIRDLINFDNVENVEMVAHDCCSTQLIKFCEMFEIQNEIEISNKPASIVKKFNNFIKSLRKKNR